ncbi:hypothetical protein I316_01268 [Kwoniella heveanensis BCC8398]|uniref:Protein SPT2 n=1 Tax=Kwoniella heveanensis BCC8398 TaxID=1296120 RepID=A0A1B9H076_9TREE|nr:hypothetical protein I316_01268 [Kwoniella heveanensis BCC8398]
MSDYQARKARALELQREKEEELKRELAAKAAREKQLAKAEEERRQRQEAAAREARRQELMRANEALNKKNDERNRRLNDMEYNPFAEDERRAPVVIKPTLKLPPNARQVSSKQSHPGPSASSPSSSKPKTKSSTTLTGTSSSSKNKDISPPPLGRKERAAKAFAQQAKRSAGDSLFSVRALVESRDSPGPSPSAGPSRLSAQGSSYRSANASANRPGPGGASAPTIAVHGIGMANGLKKDPRAMAMVQGKGKGSVRDQLRAQFQAEGMRKLCPDRATRDRRSIEEIQRDIKARSKKGAGGDEALSGGPATDRERGPKRSPERGQYGQASANGSATKPGIRPPPRPPKRDDRGRPIPSSTTAITTANAKASFKRRPSPSSSNSASDSDSYSSSSPRPSKKRYDPYSNGRGRGRSRSPPLRLNERSSQFDVSAEIQAMFRRPGRPPLPSRGYADDISDDGSSDMEAGLSDVEVEERRAARIARREDEEAEREERERKLAKEKRKKELASRGR